MKHSVTEYQHVEFIGIDFLKFIFSICIVALHSEVLSFLDDKTEWFVTHMIFRLAVPFFFVASGYFLGVKTTGASEKKRKDIFRIYENKLIPPLTIWGGWVWYSILQTYFREIIQRPESC